MDLLHPTRDAIHVFDLGLRRCACVEFELHSQVVGVTLWSIASSRRFFLIRPVSPPEP